MICAIVAAAAQDPLRDAHARPRVVEGAAIRAGIDVDRHTVRLFVLQGLLVGVAAIIDLSRNASTNVVGHQSDNLQAISAVVLGGTSLFGGIASIGGTLLGSLIPVMMANGLVLMTVQPFYQSSWSGSSSSSRSTSTSDVANG